MRRIDRLKREARKRALAKNHSLKRFRNRPPGSTPDATAYCRTCGHAVHIHVVLGAVEGPALTTTCKQLGLFE